MPNFSSIISVTRLRLGSTMKPYGRTLAVPRRHNADPQSPSRRLQIHLTSPPGLLRSLWLSLADVPIAIIRAHRARNGVMCAIGGYPIRTETRTGRVAPRTETADPYRPNLLLCGVAECRVSTGMRETT
jgi:hypothetical protein